jgi:hypothetical protein
LVAAVVMKLVTLADVPELLGHLPKDALRKETCQYVNAELTKAAYGAYPADVSVALQMVLSLGGVECRRGHS